MSEKPLLVDLCCKAGGCSVGYFNAGFEVIGIDKDPQPHYPFKFIQADVLDMDLPDADIYHASPPCQLFSIGTKKYRNKGKEYPDVLTPLRERLIKAGKPFIIENVPGAPLRKDLVLCGEMFGLRVLRHRLFEIHGLTVLQPPHIKHKLSACKGTAIMVCSGNRPGGWGKRSHYATVAGNGGNSYSFKFEDWQKAMGIFHMNKKELTQAIPPAYTEYIGRQIMPHFRPVEVTLQNS